MSVRVDQLKAALFERRDAVVRLKEQLGRQRDLVEKAKERLRSVEGDKGKLEQTYYDLYFSSLVEAQLFSEKIDQIRMALAGKSGPEVTLVQTLIDQLEAETHIDIPTLRPYPRLRVDLGLAEGCSEFCRRHRRAMTQRMITAFTGTRVNAILDLSEYRDMAAYVEAVRAKSKGNVIREVRHAASRGLICRGFDPADHVADIEAIFQSKPERQAGPLRPPYNKGAEAFLTYVHDNHPNRMPPCLRHHNTWHGIFEGTPHGDRLLGFIMIERHGQFGHYRHIVGHGDLLDQGIMFHLHFAVVEWIYASQPGLTLLSYAQWTDLPDVIDIRPGLTRWKKKTLFKPIRLIETLHGTPEDIRADIVENAKGRVFPEYVLETAQSAACIYSAALMGIRDVVHFARREIQEVTLVDNDAEMMAELRKAYSANWDYHVGDAFAFIRSARASRKRFDVVTLDPWVYLEQANVNIIKSIVGIARQYVLISLTDIHFFRPNYLKPVAEDVFRYFHAREESIVAVDVVLSTQGFGGLYWCVLKLADGTHV